MHDAFKNIPNFVLLPFAFALLIQFRQLQLSVDLFVFFLGSKTFPSPLPPRFLLQLRAADTKPAEGRKSYPLIATSHPLLGVLKSQ
jgi:hypothetical protein